MILNKKQKIKIQEICNNSSEAMKTEKESYNKYLDLAMKYTFLLNGAAAIAVTTVFTEIFIGKPVLAEKVLEAIFFFIKGTYYSAFSMLVAYGTHLWKYHGESSQNKIFKELKEAHEERHHLLEGECFFNKTSKKIDEANSWKLIAFVSNIFSVALIIISLMYFNSGIDKAKNSFIDELQKKQPEQSTICNEGIAKKTSEITPILNKH